MHHSIRALLLAGALGAFARTVAAADLPLSPGGAPATTNTFHVTTSPQPVPNGMPVMRGIVVTESNRFSFILPAGMRMQAELENQKVILVASEAGCAVTMQAVAAKGVPVQLTADALRDQVLGRFSGGKIVNETTISAGGDTGPAFDVLWRSSGGLFSTRVGFVPVPGGWLEFDYTAAVDKFQSQQAFLNQFLLSFRRSGVAGELRVAKVSAPE